MKVAIVNAERVVTDVLDISPETKPLHLDGREESEGLQVVVLERQRVVDKRPRMTDDAEVELDPDSGDPIFDDFTVCTAVRHPQAAAITRGSRLQDDGSFLDPLPEPVVPRRVLSSSEMELRFTQDELIKIEELKEDENKEIRASARVMARTLLARDTVDLDNADVDTAFEFFKAHGVMDTSRHDALKRDA